ncbi:carbohydrate kinase family protein [Acuticoccus yangtzensis]|uniref:carbohydrate kinase family protein n=1 Tax=Acuticoccus yangtzensis TaxID=1443441 RepID=UPI0009498471|nr:carbohydrate kinase [Acuticoccus yangtzensis]
MSVLVCGEMLYDVFADRRTGVSEDRPAGGGFSLDARIGGSALNVAAGLARLGVPVAQLTGVSTDVFGAQLTAFLEAEGVETRYLKRTAAPTTLAMVMPGPDGSAAYTFYGEGAADRQVELADLPSLGGVDALVFGCFSLLTRPTGDSFLELARRAKAASPAPVVVLDPNVRLAVEPDPAVWRRRIGEFAAFADLVKLSREDLETVYADAPEAQPAAWLRDGATAVIVTDGPRGARWWSAAGTVDVSAPKVSVVDTVGAGDSFLAALMAGLAERGMLTAAGLSSLAAAEARDVLAFAVKAAALTCTRRGADLPRRADLATG